jgi:apolipoprotein N-acyltransferase
MNCRRHGSKPTLALWMLVAAADVAIFTAAAGLLTVLLVGAGLVTLAAGVVSLRRLHRRDAVASLWLLPQRSAPKPKAMARRRA